MPAFTDNTHQAAAVVGASGKNQKLLRQRTGHSLSQEGRLKINLNTAQLPYNYHTITISNSMGFLRKGSPEHEKRSDFLMHT